MVIYIKFGDFPLVALVWFLFDNGGFEVAREEFCAG